MANRRQWLTRTGVAVVSAALTLTGLTRTALGTDAPSVPAARSTLPAPSALPTPSAFPSPSGTPSRPPSRPPSGTPSPAPSPATSDESAVSDALRLAGLPPMGAFTDSGADGVHRIPALETWLGGTRMRVGHTYLPGESWAGIEGGTGLLEPWAAWKRADPDRLFVLNVPMQANNEDDVSDAQVRRLIRAGASGADDAHFTALARRLVGLGVPDTVIVLGWEMNGITYTHRCGPDPAGWKTYWNRIVTAMRAVPGQHFKFDFAPNRGRDAVAWTECYPGDATVDIIGMDSYDQPPGTSFYDQVTEPYGLQAQVDFAARHKKAISYPEWGLFRNGDNPDYMSLMLGWIAAHKPLYQTITDYCPHGVWQCQANPKSSAVYRSMLFEKQPVPVPTPVVTSTPGPPPHGTPTPTPTPGVTATPTPARNPGPTVAATPAPTPARTPAAGPAEACLPMQLSDEMKKKYASGEMCVRLTPKK